MDSQELNTILRDLFKQLIDQGYKKLPMVEVTLGKTFSPQFGKFVEESDLGLIPLERMIKGLGFELHLVPVKSEDKEFHKEMDQKYQEFINTAKNDLVDYLDNRPIKSTSSHSKGSVFDDELENILNELDQSE